MLRALLIAFAALVPTLAWADMAPRFCDVELTSARALLDADLVLQVEVLEFSSKSTPTQVGETYTWKAKVKITSVVLGEFKANEASYGETCSGGSSSGGWMPPCLEPLPQAKGEKATLFLKKDGTFLRTRIEEHHASDCPAKSVVDEVKKKKGDAWAKILLPKR